MNEPQAKVLITLVNGRVREVKVDAPVRLITDLTEQAVEVARRLDSAILKSTKEDGDDRPT